MAQLVARTAGGREVAGSSPVTPTIIIMSDTTKLSEYPGLSEFLANQLVATIALPIDETGTLHIASLLYWHDPVSLCFYFVTGANTEKCRLLIQGRTVTAACVVGTEKGVDFSLQMRGQFNIVEEPTHNVIESYYAKRGNHDDDLNDPENVMLKFSPNWARFNDYSHGYGDRKFLKLDA